MSHNIANNLIGIALKERLENLERIIDADVVTIFAPIYPNIEQRFDFILKLKKTKRKKLALILQTDGGFSRTAEYLVRKMRACYDEVYFIIPEYAMSAGTILALSGDKIFMTTDSALGPIDPQVKKNIEGNEKFVPAVSFMNKYEELVEKSRKKELTMAEDMLMEKQFNLAELERFRQEIEYTKDLLCDWLSTYKFKNWIGKNGIKKTLIEKNKRALEIADILNDQKIWHNHSRRIHREVLTSRVKLLIDNVEDNEQLEKALIEYWILFRDFLTLNRSDDFLHSTEFFL